MDKETIEQLFRRHYPRMYQLARVLLKDDAMSKDAVSDVFADVLDGKMRLGTDGEKPDGIRPDGVGSYLLVCVRNKCLTLINRQKMKDRVHHLLQAEASPSVVSNGVGSSTVDALIASIDNEEDKMEAILAYMGAELTPQTRKVLDLRFRKKRKYREIANELGISEVAVYKHLAQGIKKLKERFNP